MWRSCRHRFSPLGGALLLLERLIQAPHFRSNLPDERGAGSQRYPLTCYERMGLPNVAGQHFAAIARCSLFLIP